ncbi:spherulation-specific family 4 protein [Streptomyces sp. NPDC005794]|uniref:spherulation-specific family 4 protein n=1 Tax=Streptomyces sp. NPDC005794 TaxID=3364733 RepID=UPI00369ABFF9
MPHLTSTGSTLRTGASEQLGVGVPGYAHPLLAPSEWAELDRPGTPLHWAVLNIDDGPGARPDPHCLEVAGRLRNARERALRGEVPEDTVRAAGGRLLGHLDLAWGSRPVGELVAEARTYLDWYRVGGFYLDHCPAERDGLPTVRRLTSTLSALVADSDSADEEAGRVVLGHGIHPHPGYAEAADQLVTFRGPWADYRWSQAAEWTAAYEPGRFVHLVHGVPRTHLEEAMRVARWQGAGTIFFTDRDSANGQTDPFAAPPSYWDEFVSRIGPGISE